jgi:uncharacterized SAM-dependent methyltransferase
VRANQILGHGAFDLGKWAVTGVWDEERGAHNQYYITRADVSLNGVDISAGHKLLAVRSHKYDADDRKSLCQSAGLEVVDSWASESEYSEITLPQSFDT